MERSQRFAGLFTGGGGVLLGLVVVFMEEEDFPEGVGEEALRGRTPHHRLTDFAICEAAMRWRA